MVWAGEPKRLWDNALEFEYCVRSNTSLDIYMLQGEVPDTLMLSGAYDISQFCKHGFYNWVIFKYKPIQYPDKMYADENVVGGSNDNPILDTMEYSVEFDDGEFSELTANVIAESMYAACDDSGNEYLMMDSIVDYRKIDKSLSVASHKLMHRVRSFMRRSTLEWKI